MREIKFRGVTAKSEMVYGSLSPDLPNSTSYYNDYSQRICWFPESGGQTNAPVKNGTVGQYTGLKDKNGVEIYEGDIVSDHVGTGIVKYSEIKAAYKVSYENGIYAKWFIDYMNRNERNSIEVIGNIHENPELLA